LGHPQRHRRIFPEPAGRLRLMTVLAVQTDPGANRGCPRAGGL